MKYLFFGTPDFAATILEKLIKAGFIPAAVVCNPDKPTDRKKIITPPPTKIIAQKYNIPVWQPAELKIIRQLADWKLKISGIKPDFAIVAAYSQIIPKEILEITRLGAIGAHPSLLPKYRGATPIQTAILNGEEITGVTLYLMDAKVDHGPIFAQKKLEFPIYNLQFTILQQKLAELSADLLIETLPNVEEKIKNAQSQDESSATFTKKFETEDAFVKSEDLIKAINENSEISLLIERKIRALNPEPGVFTIINNKRIKLLKAEIKEGKLKLLTIQLAGGKPIPFRPELIFQ